jgi:hypothetical protein
MRFRFGAGMRDLGYFAASDIVFRVRVRCV